MVASATNTQGHSLSFAGTNLWRCDAHVIDVCDLNCLDVDPKDGCPFCIQSCRKYCHYLRSFPNTLFDLSSTIGQEYAILVCIYSAQPGKHLKVDNHRPFH